MGFGLYFFLSSCQGDKTRGLDVQAVKPVAKPVTENSSETANRGIKEKIQAAGKTVIKFIEDAKAKILDLTPSAFKDSVLSFITNVRGSFESLLEKTEGTKIISKVKNEVEKTLEKIEKKVKKIKGTAKSEVLKGTDKIFGLIESVQTLIMNEIASLDADENADQIKELNELLGLVGVSEDAQEILRKARVQLALERFTRRISSYNRSLNRVLHPFRNKAVALSGDFKSFFEEVSAEQSSFNADSKNKATAVLSLLNAEANDENKVTIEALLTALENISKAEGFKLIKGSAHPTSENIREKVTSLVNETLEAHEDLEGISAKELYALILSVNSELEINDLMIVDKDGNTRSLDEESENYLDINKRDNESLINAFSAIARYAGVNESINLNVKDIATLDENIATKLLFSKYQAAKGVFLKAHKQENLKALNYKELKVVKSLGRQIKTLLISLYDDFSQIEETAVYKAATSIKAKYKEDAQQAYKDLGTLLMHFGNWAEDKSYYASSTSTHTAKITEAMINKSFTLEAPEADNGADEIVTL